MAHSTWNRFVFLVVIGTSLFPALRLDAQEFGGELNLASESAQSSRVETDQLEPRISRLPMPVSVDTPQNGGGIPMSLARLLRPTLRLATEWHGETDDVRYSSQGAFLDFPMYPVFGPPPPTIKLGFAPTRVEAPNALGLPVDLYATELGLAWMRRINDRWMMRLMTGASFATDGENQSSDAWRFRGGLFAIYRRNPSWTWTFGALALGRNDLPVLPAVGVIHQPNPTTRFDLIMPRPRLAFMLADRGRRQQWGYIGAALNGNTWGAERIDGVDDQLTYGDFRATIGWESIPTPEPGMPFSRGRKVEAEVAYVFSRDFEWDDADVEIDLSDTLLIRVSVSF